MENWCHEPRFIVKIDYDWNVILRFSNGPKFLWCVYCCIFDRYVFIYSKILIFCSRDCTVCTTAFLLIFSVLSFLCVCCGISFHCLFTLLVCFPVSCDFLEIILNKKKSLCLLCIKLLLERHVCWVRSKIHK